MSEAALEKSANLLVEGLWARLRDILMAQARWDHFVHDPEGGPQGRAGADGSSPARKDAGRLAAEMLRRALRVASDPVNGAILRRLAREEAVALPSLMETTGLPRIALIETVSDIAQVGLASYAAGTSEVRASAGGNGLVGLLDEVCGRLARTLEDRWTEVAHEGDAG